MVINEYFEKVYLLNLEKRPERMKLASKRMQFSDIEYTRFGATDGSVMRRIWESFHRENSYFSNPSYIGCAISHLSIYRDAIERGYKKILIVEDDNRIRYDANRIFSAVVRESGFIRSDNWDLLYLGFIPLSDDCSKWDYNIFSLIGNNLALAKNFWGLFGYGITDSLMREILEVYDREFPMELDRYFVTHIQPRNRSYGIVPQLFAADDGVSDNSGINEQGMLQRSVDARFGKLTDYI